MGFEPTTLRVLERRVVGRGFKSHLVLGFFPSSMLFLSYLKKELHGFLLLCMHVVLFYGYVATLGVRVAGAPLSDKTKALQPCNIF